MASSNITFLQNVSDKDLAHLYTTAQALIMPQEEDFGYVALEAQFFGCPVIAYNKGGATETILDETTGMFFDHQNPGDLQKALEKFERVAYTLQHSTQKKGPRHVEKFDSKEFETKLMTNLKLPHTSTI